MTNELILTLLSVSLALEVYFFIKWRIAESKLKDLENKHKAWFEPKIYKGSNGE